MPHKHVSNTHSTSTLTVSRLRQKPASSMVNPACIPNTRNAAMRVQTVLIGLITSRVLTASYGSGVAAAAAAGWLVGWVVGSVVGAATDGAVVACAWALLVDIHDGTTSIAS